MSNVRNCGRATNRSVSTDEMEWWMHAEWVWVVLSLCVRVVVRGHIASTVLCFIYDPGRIGLCGTNCWVNHECCCHALTPPLILWLTFCLIKLIEKCYAKENRFWGGTSVLAAAESRRQVRSERLMQKRRAFLEHKDKACPFSRQLLWPNSTSTFRRSQHTGAVLKTVFP
jgi:hypothetical protein